VRQSEKSKPSNRNWRASKVKEVMERAAAEVEVSSKHYGTNSKLLRRKRRRTTSSKLKSTA